MSFLTSREQVAPQGIGKPVRRYEDARLLTGGGRFADDMSLPGQAYVYIVRSPHAPARTIDTGPAEQMPGAIAVLTDNDAEGDCLQPIPHRPVPTNPHEVPFKSGDGSPFFVAPHPVLAVGKVRHVSEMSSPRADVYNVKWAPVGAISGTCSMKGTSTINRQCCTGDKG
jgi:CO/xanthine dehydrogenase Mo-binding subunit